MNSVKRGKIMENDLILEIYNVGPISHAQINIGKINIIGGKNSTGKSTSSKLLYCFLRANSSYNEDLIVEGIKPRLFRFSRELYHSKIISPSFMHKLDLDDPSLDELIEYYEELKLRYFAYESENESKLPEFWDEVPIDDEHQMYVSEAKSRQYLRNKPKFTKHINRIDEMLDIGEDSSKSFKYLMRKLIMDEFSLREQNITKFGDAICFSSKNLDFDWEIYFKENLYDIYGIFNIGDVFYLDSFSTFDLPLRKVRSIRVYGNAITDHATKLSKNIYDETETEILFDDIDNKEIIEIEEKIKTIIGGKLEIEDGQFIYKTTDNSRHTLVNTASGIKQIGTLQKLLSNRKLKPESFLIIDEPEVNLHPEWQLKFAEILVLLAKDLDITLYINTHSPLFINAINFYSELHGLEDDTNYYLTRPCENGYTFDLIDEDDLYEIYDELGQPFQEIKFKKLDSILD